MTKLRLLIGMALTLVVIMIVAIAMPAVSQQPQPRTTMTFFDPNKTNWERIVDERREGFSTGDTNLFVDAQFDPETCERRGTLIGHIVISKPLGERNAWFIGDFTLKLPDGKVLAQGAAKFAEFEQIDKGVFAVTGGTDAYRDVSGEVKFQSEQVEMCDRRGTLFTVDIGPQP